MDKQKTILIGAVLFVVLFVVVVLSIFLSGGLKGGSGIFSNQDSKRERELANSTGSKGKGYTLQGTQVNSTEKKQELFSPAYAREASKKILGWLNKTRIYNAKLEDPTESGEFVCNGGYAAAESCTPKGACAIRMIANNIGLISTWAHYKYYEQVERDPSIMKVVENDLSIYANTKKISAVQPAIWNFKLIYEMWSGQELNDKQKKIAKEVLYRMQHDPFIIDPIEKEVREFTDIPTILTFESAKQNREKPITDRDNFYSIFASEYAYSYLFVRDTKAEFDQPYLNTAVGLYNEAMNRYMITNGDATLFNPYMLGVAALDLYRVTGNATFLDTASRLADRHLKSDCETNMMLCSTKVYFYHELLKINTKQEYVQVRNSALQKLLSESYDSKEVGGHRIGKNAFYSEKKELEESLSYELVPNALLTRVLIEL